MKVKAVARVVHGKDKVAEPGTVFELEDAVAQALLAAGHVTKSDEKTTPPGTTASPMAASPRGKPVKAEDEEGL